jgi:hypothetical protein
MYYLQLGRCTKFVWFKSVEVKKGRRRRKGKGEVGGGGEGEGEGNVLTF